MAAEIELYDCELPPDAASWKYEDYVAAWHDLESMSAWVKGELAAAVETRYGKADLERYAAAVGVSYSTVKSYRAVARAFPAEKVCRADFSFGVAETLMGQEDRFELVSRSEPWTRAEARELVARRKDEKALARKDPHADLKAELAAAKNTATPASLSSVSDSMTTPVKETATATTETATEKKSHVHVYKMRCECGQEDKAFIGSYDELERRLEAEIGARHRQQVAGLQAEVARLEDENAELRRSAPLDSPDLDDPGTDPDLDSDGADYGQGDGDGAFRPCGSQDAARVVLLSGGKRKPVPLDDGTEMEWLCPLHQAAMTATTSLAVKPAPGSGDLLPFDVEPCQFPVPEEAMSRP